MASLVIIHQVRAQIWCRLTGHEAIINRAYTVLPKTEHAQQRVKTSTKRQRRVCFCEVAKWLVIDTMTDRARLLSSTH